MADLPGSGDQIGTGFEARADLLPFQQATDEVYSYLEELAERMGPLTEGDDNELERRFAVFEDLTKQAGAVNGPAHNLHFILSQDNLRNTKTARRALTSLEEAVVDTRDETIRGIYGRIYDIKLDEVGE
jgi:hypothetical protein